MISIDSSLECDHVHYTGKSLRDKQFVAVHRGGNLAPENHRKPMEWAITCFEHVLPYYNRELDQVLKEAMKFACEWSRGRWSTGDLIKASRKVHDCAKTINDPVACAIARSIGAGSCNRSYGRSLHGSSPICSKGSYTRRKFCIRREGLTD